MPARDTDQHAHRRFNSLSGNWVLVSPQRVLRPWQGKVEPAVSTQRTQHDSGCYLCPGNARANGAVNSHYQHTFVFTNDFSALSADARPDIATQTATQTTAHSLLRTEAVAGTSRVMCYSPRHDQTLADMPLADIAQVVELWVEQSAELGHSYRWVQIFENNGALMGCSNPHPHGQVWALDAVPSEVAREDLHQREHYAAHGSSLLLDYARQELELRERIVLEGEHWLVLVPYWAQWPFETLLLPRRQVARLPELTAPEKHDLAAVLKYLLAGYDALFDCSFPYSMGWHGAPFDDRDSSPWLLHAHYYPPLLRSASVKKFMVGYELLAEAQRDFAPEQAARQLRDAIQRSSAANKG